MMRTIQLKLVVADKSVSKVLEIYHFGVPVTPLLGCA
jgi:hypothetical protein